MRKADEDKQSAEQAQLEQQQLAAGLNVQGQLEHMSLHQQDQDELADKLIVNQQHLQPLTPGHIFRVKKGVEVEKNIYRLYQAM